MAIGANSYGDTEEIAALVPLRADGSGFFTISTRPTLAQVESIVDQVGGLINSVLAEYGFAIPVSQADAKLMLDLFANQEVAAIVEGINGSGRFGPTAGREPGSRFEIIMSDVRTFIEQNAVGIERLGATRSHDSLAGLKYRATDERGNATFPLFQRDAFGATFTDWDSNGNG